MTDAKVGGFTKCRVDYYRTTCQREVQQPIFGLMPFRTEVSLDNAPNFDVAGGSSQGDAREATPETLSYREVVVQLRPDDFGGCGDGSINPSNPVCQKDAQRERLVAGLQAAGYESWTWKSYTYYAKRNMPILVTIGGVGRDNAFTIGPASVATVNESLEREALRQRANAELEEKGQALVDGMKNE